MPPERIAVPSLLVFFSRQRKPRGVRTVPISVSTQPRDDGTSPNRLFYQPKGRFVISGCVGRGGWERDREERAGGGSVQNAL